MSDSPSLAPDPDCIIVGAGPAGLFLALLLARKGVRVRLLEEHSDFDRDFRGDTVHPSTLELLDQLGMVERVLALPHGRIGRLGILTSRGEIPVLDLTELPTRFPFVALIPQARLLDFLANEARQLPTFSLEMKAHVQDLLVEGDQVKGVRYRAADGSWQEARAPLTIAADGRFSRLRQLSGLPLTRTSPPMDVLWFRVPKLAGDPKSLPIFCASSGNLLVVLERDDSWQLGFIIRKGAYQNMHDPAGLAHLRGRVASLQPMFSERIASITDWKQINLLSVESSCLSRWHRPGLLLIGDAAHVMTPVGGVGINYAIQDAVESANVLASPLKARQVQSDHLALIQKRRHRAVRIVQFGQRMVQRVILGQVLGSIDETKPFQLPLPARIALKIPYLRTIPARIFALGIFRARAE